MDLFTFQKHVQTRQTLTIGGVAYQVEGIAELQVGGTYGPVVAFLSGGEWLVPDVVGKRSVFVQTTPGTQHTPAPTQWTTAGELFTRRDLFSFVVVEVFGQTPLTRGEKVFVTEYQGARGGLVWMVDGGTGILRVLLGRFLKEHQVV